MNKSEFNYEMNVSSESRKNIIVAYSTIVKYVSFLYEKTVRTFKNYLIVDLFLNEEGFSWTSEKKAPSICLFFK